MLVRQNSKIILHACCAVCATYPIELLKKEGYSPIIYFDNPNIYPFEEYERRRFELANYCKKYNIEYCQSEYDNENWEYYIKGFENEPEKGLRCYKCFYYRLKNTAKYAVDNKIKYFTTTLTVSPHKRSQEIFKVGKNVQSECENKTEFLEFDFKKQNGYLISTKNAKLEGFYRQSYCGCKYSIRK